MEFVLDDQCGRRGAVLGIVPVEESGRRRAPGHGGELVDGGDDQCRAGVVDRIVDQMDRQAVGELAAVAGAADVHPLGLLVDLVRTGVEMSAAPAARVQLHGVLRGQALVEIPTKLGQLLLGLLQRVGSG